MMFLKPVVVLDAMPLSNKQLEQPCFTTLDIYVAITGNTVFPRA